MVVDGMPDAGDDARGHGHRIWEQRSEFRTGLSRGVKERVVLGEHVLHGTSTDAVTGGSRCRVQVGGSTSSTNGAGAYDGGYMVFCGNCWAAWTRPGPASLVTGLNALVSLEVVPAFFDHVRRARRPVINSPKGQEIPLPPDLVRRAVVDPKLYWTWSLVWRRGEERAAVRAVADALAAGVGDFGIHAPGAWLPDSDPYKV